MIDLEGMDETQKYIERLVGDLTGPPVLEAMRDCTLKISRDVQHNMQADWHDLGRSMSSVTPEITMRDRVLMGVVGSNVTYVPYGEFGTGIYAGRPRYFPPPDALEPWAKRHGIPSGFLVARAIWKAGGLKARRFFQKAMEKNIQYVHDRFDRFVTMIVERR